VRAFQRARLDYTIYPYQVKSSSLLLLFFLLPSVFSSLNREKQKLKEGDSDRLRESETEREAETVREEGRTVKTRVSLKNRDLGPISGGLAVVHRKERISMDPELTSGSFFSRLG
jgi:hypothetical protein